MVSYLSAWLQGALVILSVFLWAGPLQAADFDFAVKIGVLANRGVQQCLDRWSPTAEYLTTCLPGKKFVIFPLGFDQVNPVVEQGQVDFILTNSSSYVELETRYGINRIATLKNKRLSGVYTTFGGVIFCLKNNRDVHRLKDFTGKRFMAVEKTSLGGWIMAWREFAEAGIDPLCDFYSLEFGGTHDAVVYAVMDKTVDGGTVRTETLERMALEGKIDIDAFHVIHSHGDSNVHLPFLHSTRQYPEWPMAKVGHTPDALAEAVAIKLIEMPPDSKAAQAASCSGWTIPLNYQSVHECLKYLKLSPYEDLGKFSFHDVMLKYWVFISLALLLFVTMAVFMAVFVRLNRNIRVAGLGLEREIKKHKQTAEMLQIAKSEAEVANQTKGKFLANMSHEIRTPMNTILGMSCLCLATGLTPRQRNYIEKVHQSARMLLGIINDILDLSKIEAGKLELESICFSLNGVLENLRDMIYIKVQGKGLELLFDLSPGVPKILVGDPLRLVQVLLNLVDNAVKFTDSGEIVVSICPVKMGAETIELEFKVKDTGIGMTTGQLARIFQSYRQADTSIMRKFGGTGLGLAICKYLVGLMNGRLQVQSEQGKGSCFSFNAIFGRSEQALPRSGVPANFKQPGVQMVDDMAGISNNGMGYGEGVGRDGGAVDPWSLKILDTIKGAHILLVEDNPINQELAKEFLTRAGLQVTIAGNGQIAVDLIKTMEFDAVLMDIQMPVMDGYEAAKIIRTLKSATELPIIAMTASAMAGDREKSLESGMNDHVPKPIEQEVLFQSLVQWISPSMGKGPAVSAGGETFLGDAPQVIPHLEGVDVKAGLSRASGRKRLYARLLKAFSLDHGRDHRAIARAIESGDVELALRTAHTLKSVAGGLGILSVCESATQVERAIQENRSQTFTALLDTLARTLEPVVEAVNKKMTPPFLSDTLSPGDNPVDGASEKISTMVQRLEKLAQNMDPGVEKSAQELFKALDLLGDSPRTLGLKLMDYTERFDFDNTLDTLSLLKTTLGIDIPGG